MKNMMRLVLFGFSLCLNAVLLVAMPGCSSIPAPTTISAAAGDASTLAAAVKAIAPQLLAQATDPATAAKIQADIDAVAVAAAAVQTATAGADTSQVQQLVAVVNALANVALPLVGLPPGLVTVVQAAVALLPVMAQAVGLTGATAAPSMDPAAARLILTKAAAGV